MSRLAAYSLDNINKFPRDNFPTIAVIFSNQHMDPKVGRDLTDRLLDIGCVFFLIVGDASNEIEDLIDEVLESHGANIPTTSHERESKAELANFLMHGGLIAATSPRYLFVFSENFPDQGEWIGTFRELMEA